MGRPGFEPGTDRLKAEYSTVELATLVVFFDNVHHYSMDFYSYASYLKESNSHFHQRFPTRTRI